MNHSNHRPERLKPEVAQVAANRFHVVDSAFLLEAETHQRNKPTLVPVPPRVEVHRDTVDRVMDMAAYREQKDLSEREQQIRAAQRQVEEARDELAA